MAGEAQRVLITGGSGHIGQAIAAEAVELGLEPVIFDLVAARIGSSHLVDLSDSQALADALATVLSDGPITRLVNGVGQVFPGPLAEQTLVDFDRAHALNLRAAAQCAQALLPGMTAAGFGRIVNLTSRAALGKPQRSAYVASKAGLLGLTRVWALELGEAGITANAVGPGPLDAGQFQGVNPAGDSARERLVQSIPVRRMGTPEDVSRAVHFFLAEHAGFVTGQMLYVCGGLSVGSEQL